MKYFKTEQRAKQVLVFSKWRRKSYSLFQTLRKEVVISVLATTYLLSVPAVSLATETDTTEVKMQYNLDEIEVNAQRTPALYSQVARIITVIERKEIESSPAQSVQQLLEYVAGVDVRQRGAEEVQADISIRGGTFDQTLILLNGINITDPQTGHHNFNLPVSLSQIERIEILEGPAARVYGPNAFSGAINIVTQKPENKKLGMETSFGSFGYLDANISGSFNIGKLQNGIAVSRKKSDGYIDNTDFVISNVYYSNVLNSKKGVLGYQFGWSEKGFGANSFYTPKYPNQYENIKTTFTSVKWESNSRFHFTPVFYWRNQHDRFELFRDNPASWYKTHNYHLTNTFGANLNSWVQSRFGKTAFGVEFRSENILSNVLGEMLESPQKVKGEDAEYTKSVKRNIVSGFLEHAVYYNNLTFTAGLMGNVISDSNLGIHVFPGLDVSYKVAPALKIFSTYNTSLRMPTFTDLYYSGPTNIGNPDLRPEKSAAIEGGIKWNSGIVNGHFTLFYRRGRDIIDWVKKSEDELWQPQNLTQLKSFGSEIRVQFNLREKLGGKFPNKIYFNYFNNNLKKEELDFISNYVLDNLKHKFTGSVNQPICNNVNLDIKVSFQDREGTFTVFENGNWGKEKQYDPFWLVDGNINYTNKNLRFFISVNNVFDLKYQDIGNVIQPGRWIKSGFSYQLNFK